MAKPTQVSSALIDAFAAQKISVEDFILDFDFWKSLPDDQETDVFGRDGANRGSKYFRHVHIVPFNDKRSLARWRDNHENGRGNKSNRYLFYVDGGAAYGYLLLYVIDDPEESGQPGAHDIWGPENTDLLDQLNQLADKFYDHGMVP